MIGMKRRSVSYVLILITVFLWGLSFLSIKAVISIVPPMTLGFLRFAIAIFLLWILKAKSSPNERLARKDILIMSTSGILGVSLYFLMENNGIKLLTPSEASIIVGSIPIFSMLSDRIFLKSRISVLQGGGAILSVLGVILLIGLNITLSNSVLGYCFMFGAVFCWIGYAFLTRPLFAKYSKPSLTFYQNFFGFLGFIPFALLEYPQWRMPDAFGWMHIAYLGVFCSAIGYFFYLYALEDLGITVSSVFINLIPVVTVIAEIILGARLTVLQLCGGAMVVIGVYMATFGEKKQTIPTGD